MKVNEIIKTLYKDIANGGVGSGIKGHVTEQEENLQKQTKKDKNKIISDAKKEQKYKEKIKETKQEKDLIEKSIFEPDFIFNIDNKKAFFKSFDDKAIIILVSEDEDNYTVEKIFYGNSKS